MVLCPSRKTLEANLKNHLSGFKHQKAVEDAQKKADGANQVAREATTTTRTGRCGRLSKGIPSSSQSTQLDLHSWFGQSSANNEQGMSPIIDQRFLATVFCYGFRGPIVEYAGNSYEVTALLNDLHPGVSWYVEPHLNAVVFVNGISVSVTGTFRHKNCMRLSVSGAPFPNLTCSMCACIPVQDDFKRRVRREDRSLVKRGHQTPGSGIRPIGFRSL